MKTYLFYMSLIGWLLFIIMLSVFSTNCMSAPDRTAFTNEECYLSADCLYRNKGNNDKSICAELIRGCTESNKENRIKQRLEYCNKNKFQGMTENECRLYLNQK